MKISKKTLLTISGLLSISAFGLMFVYADINLSINPSNAIQHIEKVKFITGNNQSGTLSNNNGFVKIDAKNLIIGQSGDNENIITGNRSDILGGARNIISGSYDVILGGSGNNIAGTYNTILGGEGNKIRCGSYHTIVGGNNNNITTSQCVNDHNNHYSVIVGGHDNTISGDFSVIMGNNSSITGNYSVALGSGSKIKSNNSFLWTDGSSTEILEANNVFVIMAKSGAVINTDTAHRFAKLTLGGPLIILESKTQDKISCKGGEGGGTLKIEESTGGQLCLCSCDGSGWNSMSSHGVCLNVCSPSAEPECGTEVTHICTNEGVEFSGSCSSNAKVVEGAYFVDKDSVIHRSCQTDDGRIKSCTGQAKDINEGVQCLEHLSQCRFGAQRDKNGNLCQTSIQCTGDQIATDDGRCLNLASCLNSNSGYDAGNNKNLEGFAGGFKLNRYRPIGVDKIWECVDREITEDDAHQCRFSCDDNHECVFVGTGFRQSGQKAYRTCKSKGQNICTGDYKMGTDGSMDIYGELTNDTGRLGKVYKNPDPAGGKSQIFTFLSSMDEIYEKVNNNEYGCFTVCDPGYHEPCRGSKEGHCSPNCEYKYSSYKIETIQSSGGRINSGDCRKEDGTIKSDGNKDRRHRKYKTKSNYNQFKEERKDELGIGEANSCIWSCPDDTTPIVIYGIERDTNRKIIKHAYPIIGEFRGDNHLNEFEEFLKQTYVREANNDASDNLVCWYQCNNDKEYFDGRKCNKSIPNGYVIDKDNENNRITYKEITNYGIRKKCNNDEIRDYDQKTCIPQEVDIKEDCDKTPWKKWSNGVCIVCNTTGQYVTEDLRCNRCSLNEHILETSCTCGTGELRLRRTNQCLPEAQWLEEKRLECTKKQTNMPRYKRITATNECKTCTTTGQYMDDNGNCLPCKNNLTNDNDSELCTCNEGEIRIYQIDECIPNNLTPKRKCEKIIEKKPWYKRITTINECKACEPGKYVKDDGICTPCDEDHNNECTPQPST